MLYVFPGPSPNAGPFRFPNTATPRIDGNGMLFIEDENGEVLGAFRPENWESAVVGDEDLFPGLNVGLHEAP